jgi:hypothetical protein
MQYGSFTGLANQICRGGESVLQISNALWGSIGGSRLSDVHRVVDVLDDISDGGFINAQLG